MDNRNDDKGPVKGVNTVSILSALSTSPHVENARDKVTITLYSLETHSHPGYSQSFLKEATNIKKIRDGLVNAAIKFNRETPEIILSILLIPDWDKKDNSYDNNEYKQNKSAFLHEARRVFEKIDGIVVEDFYLKVTLTHDEKAYMHHLKAKGSNADMVKTRAIIDNLKRCRHLQIDSNTVVPSFEELYNKTFVARQQKDGINASFYDDDYVSAHNKMIYTTPIGGLATHGHLQEILLDWCGKHKNDNNTDQDKRPEKNSIYARVFTEALLEVGYVVKFLDPKYKTIYPATLDDKVYWLTECMVTAVNQSWGFNVSSGFDELIKLPAIQIGNDGYFDFQCFFNVIKKHTADLSMHSEALNLDDETVDGEASRQLLLKNSNLALELQSVKDFYNASIQSQPQQARELSKIIPDTRLGNILTNDLFGVSVKELHYRASEISNTATSLKMAADPVTLARRIR